MQLMDDRPMSNNRLSLRKKTTLYIGFSAYLCSVRTSLSSSFIAQRVVNISVSVIRSFIHSFARSPQSITSHYMQTSLSLYGTAIIDFCPRVYFWRVICCQLGRTQNAVFGASNTCMQPNPSAGRSGVSNWRPARPLLIRPATTLQRTLFTDLCFLSFSKSIVYSP